MEPETADRPNPASPRQSPSGRSARARRAGLYGPPPRLTPSTPLQGRLLWAIGDWGRASEHIGTQWERAAADLLRGQIAEGEHLVVLAHVVGLAQEVFATNLAHADALLGSARAQSLVLEPLDFKWSLETASAKQVSAETLERLLAAGGPRLTDALMEARVALGLAPEAEVAIEDGRFVAPVHPSNRRALQAEPDLRTILLQVDAQAFFRPLPAWPSARAVARFEGCDLERLSSLDGVERYYRIGAGVAGALTRLATGVFDEEPAQVDTPAEIERMRRSGNARTLNLLLITLERGLTARRALEEQVAGIPRQAYAFARLRADLARAGTPKVVLDSRGALGKAYGEVQAALAREVREAGRALMREGRSVEEALAVLAGQAEHWGAEGATHAARVGARFRGNAAQSG